MRNLDFADLDGLAAEFVGKVAIVRNVENRTVIFDQILLKFLNGGQVEVVSWLVKDE